MELREVLIDGVEQLADWLDDALASMSTEQLNWLPEGKTVSAGFNAWHVLRTQDNIVNFVFQKKPPVWMAAGYLERMALPKVEQGTGMGLEQARAIVVPNVELLREYGAAVRNEVIGYLRGVSAAELGETQMIKPLGEMPRWRVVRQVLMTHGFMHLGEINMIKGMLGMQLSI